MSGPASGCWQFIILFRSKRERHRDRDSTGVGSGSSHMECQSCKVKGCREYAQMVGARDPMHRKWCWAFACGFKDLRKMANRVLGSPSQSI